MSAWTVGLIADTHIPDRARSLPPAVLRIFDRAGVCCILHAGDVVTAGVLAQLARLAPVYAVQGNRDLLLAHRLPRQRLVQVGPFTLGLVHGHGSWPRYMGDKMRYFLGRPLPFRRFVLRARQTFPQADVVVFGHIHYPWAQRFGRQWVLNPGSPVGNDRSPVRPSVALLHLRGGQLPRPEFVFLPQ